MSRRTGPTQKVRDLIFERDENTCRLCGLYPCGARLAIHHRKPRGRGGDNRRSNLVLLGDVGGCHDLVVESLRTAAYSSGWLVRTGEDPAQVPIVWNGVRVLLTDGGDVVPIDLGASA